MRLARGILAGLIVLGLAGVVEAQSPTAGPSKLEAANSQQSNAGRKSRPNILFIIMDDVGIDQMHIFGYGGLTPPLDAKHQCGGTRWRPLPQCLVDAGVLAQSRSLL